MDIQAIEGASPALDQAQLETEMHAREASVAALQSEMRKIRKLWEPIEVAQQNKKLSVSGALPLTAQPARRTNLSRRQPLRRKRRDRTRRIRRASK